MTTDEIQNGLRRQCADEARGGYNGHNWRPIRASLSRLRRRRSRRRYQSYLRVRR